MRGMTIRMMRFWALVPLMRPKAATATNGRVWVSSCELAAKRLAGQMTLDGAD